MSLIHTRRTGKTGRDLEKVTGADWDDPHVYGPGSIFTSMIVGGFVNPGNEGAISVGFWSLSTPMDHVDFSSILAGSLPIALPWDEAPIPPGAKLDSVVSLKVWPPNPPAGWSFECYANDYVDERRTVVTIYSVFNSESMIPAFYYEFDISVQSLVTGSVSAVAAPMMAAPAMGLLAVQNATQETGLGRNPNRRATPTITIVS